MTNLTYLHLSYNNITDITPLSGLTNLTLLYLTGNRLTDLTPLSGLANLTTLSLSFNSISDVTPLSGLANLTNLSLDRNRLTDLTPLSGLTRLDRLYLYTNSVSDISPLVANTGLGGEDVVDVRNNPLSAISYKTHVFSLQDRGVFVFFGALKPAVEKTGQDIPGEMMELLLSKGLALFILINLVEGIGEWEAGDYIYRKWMEERKGVIRQKSK